MVVFVVVVVVLDVVLVVVIRESKYNIDKFFRLTYIKLKSEPDLNRIFLSKY